MTRVTAAELQWLKSHVGDLEGLVEHEWGQTDAGDKRKARAEDILSRLGPVVEEVEHPFDDSGQFIYPGQRIIGHAPKGPSKWGIVLRLRKDPRGGRQGWIDVKCDDGQERSFRPSMCALALPHDQPEEFR